MAPAIESVNQHSYVLVKYSGRLDEETSKKSRGEIEELLSKNGWNKILIDIAEAEFIPSVFQIFIFLSRHVFLFSNDVHIALLIYDEEKQNARFCETVAFNRGIDLRVFFEKEKAVEWIKSIE